MAYMKTLALFFNFAALLFPVWGYAQQPPPPQTPPQPCVVPTPAPVLPKGMKLHIPNKLQKLIAKQKARIEEQTGIIVDPNQAIHDATAPKPCPPPTPVTPAKTQ